MPQPREPESKVLDYAPVQPPGETSLERVTKVLIIIGLFMFLVGSITLDGGGLWIAVSLLFGPLMGVCGFICIALARTSGRKIRLVGPLAAVLGTMMLAFGLLG